MTASTLLLPRIPLSVWDTVRPPTRARKLAPYNRSGCIEAWARLESHLCRHIGSRPAQPNAKFNTAYDTWYQVINDARHGSRCQHLVLV